MTRLEALIEAIEIAGGQSALAAKLTLLARAEMIIPKSKKVTQQSVYNWVYRQKQSPSKFARLISSAVNGAVTSSQLRPDLYPHDSNA